MSPIKRFVAFFLLFCSATPTLGTEPGGNRRFVTSNLELPARLSGINLFHLDPRNDDFQTYIDSPDLVRNFSAMRWNTYRLPVLWKDLANDQGGLNSQQVAEAGDLLRGLVARLRETHQQIGERIFLIIDFHQYKFGAQCGGVGFPREVISTDGLRPNDHACLFKAYHRFWNNENNVQNRWIEMAMALMPVVHEVMLANSDWLTLGIEPMNEPQFGDPAGLFRNDVISTISHLRTWTRSGGPQRQIDEYLIPFYRRFMTALLSLPIGGDLATRAIFIAEPFVFDHLKIRLGVSPFQVEIRIDGRYQGMTALASMQGYPIRWLASPHHYLGAADPGLLDALPPVVSTTLARYPNSYFGTREVTERISWVVSRMREGGMESFFGEWGTQNTLLDPQGRFGGHQRWINDSKRAIEQNSLGALWWQYRTDPDPHQRGFYLLQTRTEDGRQIPRTQQIMKCTPPFDLAFLAFGRCPTESFSAVE